jgi:hypothetical protein
MGKLRKVGWVISRGKIDWRDRDRRTAHNAKIARRAATQTNAQLRELVDSQGAQADDEHDDTPPPIAKPAKPISSGVVYLRHRVAR